MDCKEFHPILHFRESNPQRIDWMMMDVSQTYMLTECDAAQELNEYTFDLSLPQLFKSS